MKVFIVIELADYDHEYFFGVFSTYKKAKDAVMAYIKGKSVYTKSGKEFDITEVEIDKL